ncbi:MAG: hypothetical protein ACKVOU_03290 [Cytophagales bacterium]
MIGNIPLQFFQQLVSEMDEERASKPTKIPEGVYEKVGSKADKVAIGKKVEIKEELKNELVAKLEFNLRLDALEQRMNDKIDFEAHKLKDGK